MEQKVLLQQEVLNLLPAANNNFRSSPNTALDYAGDFTVKFRVKGINGTTIKAQFFGCCGNPSGPDLAMTGAWLEYTHTFTGLTAGGNTNIRIVGVTAGTFYIDDAYFTFNLPSGSTLLTTNVNGAGTIAKTPNQSYYSPTDNVSLEALPATHWNFDNWSGDLAGSTNPETILMDANKTVTANFSIDPSFLYDFQFTTDPDLEGWSTDPQLAVTSHTGGLVTLTPTADQWARFSLFDFPIPTGTYNKVTITLKNESTNDDQITAIVIKGGDTQVLVPLAMTTSNAGFESYPLILSAASNWIGDVDSIRIRFTDSSKDGTGNEGKSSGTGNIIIDNIVFSFDPALSSINFETASLSFYPNPANDIVYFNESNTISKVTLFDITGKKVLETSKLDNNTLNVSSLKAGLYLLSIEDKNNNTSVKKLIKK